MRLDSYIYEGYEIPVYYDPMIGKLIVWAVTREYAIERMRRVLYEFKLTGIKNNIAYLRAIMSEQDFAEGHYDTGFIERHGDRLAARQASGGTTENIAIIASYLDYLMNLEENASGDSDEGTTPISRWREFGLRKGVLRI